MYCYDEALEMLRELEKDMEALKKENIELKKKNLSLEIRLQKYGLLDETDATIEEEKEQEI